MAVLGALAVLTAETVVAGELAGLAALHHVRLDVHLAHPLETMRAPDLAAHLAGALLRAEPPLTVQDGAADRIRLTVSVRPVNATVLRGFWLPFSGTYGVGTLRLGVERMVTLSGVPRTFPGLVWLTDRNVAVSWRTTDGEITRLLDEMVAELLEARRRSHGRR